MWSGQRSRSSFHMNVLCKAGVVFTGVCSCASQSVCLSVYLFVWCFIWWSWVFWNETEFRLWRSSHGQVFEECCLSSVLCDSDVVCGLSLSLTLSLCKNICRRRVLQIISSTVVTFQLYQVYLCLEVYELYQWRT